MYRLFCNGKDITNFISELTTSDNIDALSVEMSFTVVKNPKDKYLTASAPVIACGDKLVFMNDERELFRGIVLSVGLDGSVTANDYGFYLNKSEIILQCNKVSASEAIIAMCAKAGVPTGDICDMPTLIEENFIGSTPSDILNSIIEQVTAERGKNYYYNVSEGKLNVYEYPTSPITAYYHQVAGSRFDITWLLGEVSGSATIEEMKNSVKVIKSENDIVTELTGAEDESSISKYGLLQKVVTTTSKEVQSPSTIARNTLSELNTVTYDYSVDNIFGSDDVRSGVMLLFSSTAYGVEGKYIVTEAVHNYGATHTMSLRIKRTVSP